MRHRRADHDFVKTRYFTDSLQPAIETEFAIFLDLGVGADDQPLFRARSGHIQYASVFRIFLLRQAQQRQTMGDIARLISHDVQRYAELIVKQPGRFGSPTLMGGISDDRHGKFQSLRLVHRHQLHRAARFDRRFTFTRGNVAQRDHVVKEIIHADQFTAMRIP